MNEIRETITLIGELSATETMSAELSAGKASSRIVDSNGYIIIDNAGNALIDYHMGSPIDGVISDVLSISAELSPVEDIDITLSAVEGITATIGVPSSIGGQPYTGSYEVTPSTEMQVLNTAGKSMRANITINPIPSNYGLITWDGTKLTVS